MKKTQLKIGILDVQGSVEEHAASVRRMGLLPIFVKTVTDLEGLDGLIIPGGESTTIGMLCEMYGLKEAIIKAVRCGIAVYGTCAGAILLTKWGLLDIEVARNAYGRQTESFDTEIEVPELGKKFVPAVFIRAPRFIRVGKGVKVLAEYKGEPVLVQQGNILASSFHPEMTGDLRIHKYFAENIIH